MTPVDSGRLGLDAYGDLCFVSNSAKDSGDFLVCGNLSSLLAVRSAMQCSYEGDDEPRYTITEAGRALLAGKG